MESPATDQGNSEPGAGEELREHRGLVRRVLLFSFCGYVSFALFSLISGGFRAWIGLTCSALVTMINFLWLEEIVVQVLQPSPQLRAWRLGVRALARYAVFGAAVAVCFYIARFDAISVLLGFSVIVAGIMGEAVYATWKSFSRP